MHSDFQTLAAEILKPGNPYILKTANRIYGEKTYPFHNVSVNVFLFINKNRRRKQKPAIKYTFSLGASEKNLNVDSISWQAIILQ